MRSVLRRLRCLGHLLDVLRAAVGAAATRAGRQIDVEPELGGDHHLVADRRQRLADELLVGERPVDLGRIEEGHTPFVRERG